MQKQTFTPTPGMISAAEALFMAMALEQTVRPIVRAYQEKILAEAQWSTDPHWLDHGMESFVILDPKDAFLMSNANFAEYDARCKVERIAAGLHVDDPEQCPLCVADHTVALAKHALIEEMTAITPNVTANRLLCAGMEKYDEFIELTLRLLAPFCKNRLKDPQFGS